MSDLESLSKTYGVISSYSYSEDMLEFELYRSIIYEMAIAKICAPAAILLIIFLITGSIRITVVTLFSSGLADLFVIALLPAWGLKFNDIVFVHFLCSISISVLYSLQMAHTFLLVETPQNLTRLE